MKKSVLFAVLLAIAASCNIKDINAPTFSAPTLYGYTESNQATKTEINVDTEGVGTIYWNASEEINVFFGNINVRYRSTNTEKNTSVEFEPVSQTGGTESSMGERLGLYPFDADATSDGSSVTTTVPAAQQGVPGSFGNNLFPMIAHANTDNLHFKNVCGGIKFSLSRNDIKRISFKGNNDEDIVGKVNLTFNGSGNPTASIIEGENVITLTPKDADTFASGTDYYLVMLPTVLSDGFSMAFETEDTVGLFEYTVSSIEIKRSVFARKADIDKYITFHFKEETDITSWAKHNKDADL